MEGPHSGRSNVIWSAGGDRPARPCIKLPPSIVITDEPLLIGGQYGASLINRGAAHYKRHGLMPAERASSISISLSLSLSLSPPSLDRPPARFNRHDVNRL